MGLFVHEFFKRNVLISSLFSAILRRGSELDFIVSEVLLTEDPQSMHDIYTKYKIALFGLVNLNGTIELPVNIKG